MKKRKVEILKNRMLAILFIKMTWYKVDRNPQGTANRKPYYMPRTLENLYEKICQDGNQFDVFIYKVDCVQNGSEVSESISIEHCDIDSINEHGITNIDITSEENGYRVKWFDDGMGRIKRRGGNEDFGKKGRKLAGVPNVLNETAFVLGNDASGKISWNNRFSSYHGQWYQQYQMYMINTNIFDTNLENEKKKKSKKNSCDKLFVREYDYEYSQMADLF